MTHKLCEMPWFKLSHEKSFEKAQTTLKTPAGDCGACIRKTLSPDPLQPAPNCPLQRIASCSFPCHHCIWGACLGGAAHSRDSLWEQMSVVVIGAGFAGLSAARTLQAGRSLQVTVLEGSSRVGGRAHTLQVWNKLTLSIYHTLSDRPSEKQCRLVEYVIYIAVS